jgi:hypothetical protein
MQNSVLTIKIKDNSISNSLTKEEKLKVYTKKYYELNKEKIKARIKESSKTEDFKQKRRELNKKRKEANREIYYKKRYNITLEEYNRMLILQNSQCGICKISETEIKHGRNTYFAVDHCHISGKVRGLLCYKCNSLLGFVNDEIETLKNAIKYLEYA